MVDSALGNKRLSFSNSRKCSRSVFSNKQWYLKNRNRQSVASNLWARKNTEIDLIPEKELTTAWKYNTTAMFTASYHTVVDVTTLMAG
jgi:hypothetical protein